MSLKRLSSGKVQQRELRWHPASEFPLLEGANQYSRKFPVETNGDDSIRALEN